MKNFYTLLFLFSVLSTNAQVTLTLQPDACTGKDAYLGQPQGNQNFGDASEITTVSWTCGGNPCYATSLLQFDFNSIPAGSTITSATLSLYANLTASNGYLGTPTWGTDNAGYLKRVTTAWTESTVTWNSQPATTTTDAVLLAQSTNTAQDYLNIDITTFAQYWNQNPSQNYGMLLEMITTTAYNSLIFCSSDYPDSTKRPKLELCYSIPTSIEEVNSQSQFSVYPNPATSILEIKTGNIVPDEVLVYNMTGEIIRSVKQNSVNVADIASGIYVAEIRVGDIVKRVKWAKM